MEILYILLVLLLVTRAFGELAVRIGQPALVGELVSGIALGLIVQQYAHQLPVLSELTENHVFLALTDLGVFFLMLLGGIELRPKDVTDSSGPSIVIALCGMLVPLGAGFGMGWLFLPDSSYKVAQCLFVGTALAITAVPVAIRVLMDLGNLKSRAGRTIVSAAIVDDVLSLLVLAVLTGMIQTGKVPDLPTLLLLIAKIAAFFLITFVVGHFVFPRVGKLITRLQVEEFEFSALLLVALSFAVLAELLGLHFILGAFLAGLFFARQTAGKKVYADVKKKTSAVTTGFLAPLFFASIGLHLDLSAVVEIPVIVVSLVVAAVLTKLVGAGLPAYLLGFSKRESLAVGIGMSARGAVELIIADIALRAGLFNQPEPPPPEVEYLFSTIVIVALLTTLLTPMGLKLVFRKAETEES